MKYKSNYERYKAIGTSEIDAKQKLEICEMLGDELLEQSEKLNRLRTIAGFNQSEFAEILSVTQSAVSQWEKGTKKPSAEILIYLADLYETDIKEFLTAFGFTFANR